ncbi:TonB-dependent receptor [Sphingobacterium sp. UT-1RO-CII-1]|uniref:TonB-dependent receptor plug domain-containing protein n=1 Tax=Sphingobacterium sp. UT-1RO-CII-1 TaxID=2995225 RepID=UPI00227BFDD9|nr:TonB-dependent receptor [Sphingobacterium sp. UT-1RO-CII-1]MCY4779059.1 TonB-dependent receptor [Sphingobacterium sp. UT-1RO-CII-1]
MNKLFLIGCLMGVSFVGRAQTGISDTTVIGEIMIAENRMQIPFSKRNRNIQIIGREEIAKMPVQSINEVLSYIPGVDVRQRGAFGAQADISIDGGSFEQALILINGVKVSDVQTAHHSMNIPVSLDAIERIEILKGPAARVYGINALTGAINIITQAKKGKDVSVRVQAGSSLQGKDAGDGSGVYGGGSIQAVANMGTERLQNLVAIGASKSNGQRYNSGTEDIKGFYQGKYTLNEENSIDLMGGYIHNAFGANGFYAAPGDKESHEVVQTGMLSLGMTSRLANRLILKPRLSYRHNEDDYRYFRHDLSKARSEHKTNVYAAELNGVLNTKLGDVGLGLESRYEEIKSTNLGNHDRYNHGMYAEFKTEALNRLLVNVGTYLNYNTQYGWQVFPGIDLGYELTEHVKASLSAGSSQRIPSYTDLYLQQAGNIGNPNLKSENAWQYEVGLRYEKKKVYVQGNVFYRNITDFVDWIRNDENEPYQPFNFGANKMLGAGIHLGQQFGMSDGSSFKYDVSYNYLKPKEMSYAEDISSKYIVESLKHQFLLKGIYQLKGFDFTAGGRWIKRELNDPYFVADVRVGYRVYGWDFYVEGTNLLNETYKEVAAVYLPKRWYMVGMRYQWGR